MKITTLVARLLLGLIFFIFGLNGFLQILPLPEHLGPAGDFLGALAATGYFFPFLKILEILCGALLLANFFVPLSLAVLAPIVVNIFLFHCFLEPSGVLLPSVIILLELFLVAQHKKSFQALFQAKS